MQKEFKNKQEFIVFILEELNKKFAPVKFGDFFMEISPSFGIENFQNLLEELHQQELLTKISDPGEYIPAIGRRTLDLRYGISIKGIEYINTFEQAQKNDTTVKIEKIEKEVEEKINVFVTYSWDNPEHNEKVLAFTNFLRDNGFHAEVDKMIIQTETAKDFKMMMHKGMTDFKKIIVILSSGYKIKAEEFKGGVGNEYSLILKDIDENPNKYILVSFEGFSNEIIPLFFKTREIVDLSSNNEEEKEKLFAKLQDKYIYEFNKVASKLPEIKTKEIASLFKPKEDLISDINLKFNQGSASYFARMINNVELQPNLTFKNNSTETLTDFSIEVFYPKNTVSFEVDGRIEGEYKVILIENKSKIFSQQTKSIPLEKVILRDYTIRELIDMEFVIKIYTEKGNFEQKYPVKDIIIRDIDGREQKLSVEIFNNSRY